MWEINTDEPLAPRPKPRRRSGAGTWLIRCGFLLLHLAMIGAALAWVEGWAPFSGQGRDAKAAPPSVSRAAPPPALVAAPPPPIPPKAVGPGRPMPPGPAPRPSPAPAPAPPKTPGPGKGRGESLKGLREGDSEGPKGPAPEVVLAGQGLTRSGSVFVLADEDACTYQLRKANATLRDGLAATADLAAVLENDAWIADLRRQRIEAEFNVRTGQNGLDIMPSRGNNVIVNNFNTAGAYLAQCKNALAVIDRDLKHRLELASHHARPKELGRKKAEIEQTFREDVAELRRLVDSTGAKYADLARNADVATALDGLGKTRGGGTLGPSDQFRGIVEELPKVERKILPAR